MASGIDVNSIVDTIVEHLKAGDFRAAANSFQENLACIYTDDRAVSDAFITRLNAHLTAMRREVSPSKDAANRIARLEHFVSKCYDYLEAVERKVNSDAYPYPADITRAERGALTLALPLYLYRTNADGRRVVRSGLDVANDLRMHLEFMRSRPAEASAFFARQLFGATGSTDAASSVTMSTVGVLARSPIAAAALVK